MEQILFYMFRLVQNQLAMNQAALSAAPGDERIGWTAYNRYDAVNMIDGLLSINFPVYLSQALIYASINMLAGDGMAR